ncbi:T6SS effector amidase Tae4 family protein [Prosthecobacter sp. SYSU 5D2]|uniref:T6SS effector amidase Tae4 family protein n=1 Tax=Prosthecobacter sp. SYSU 5D2 TaxID=3134134 RepID=UPI0031FF2F6C
MSYTPANSGNKVLPTYAELEKHYPVDPQGNILRVGGNCAIYENQCAIRMSTALQAAGFPLDGGFATNWGPVCLVNQTSLARGAKPLADYIWRTFGAPVTLDTSSSATISGKKGIVYFDQQGSDNNIIVYRHIDLWDGTKTKGYNPFGTGSSKVWFWLLP